MGIVALTGNIVSLKDNLVLVRGQGAGGQGSYLSRPFPGLQGSLAADQTNAATLDGSHEVLEKIVGQGTSPDAEAAYNGIYNEPTIQDSLPAYYTMVFTEPERVVEYYLYINWDYGYAPDTWEFQGLDQEGNWQTLDQYSAGGELVTGMRRQLDSPGDYSAYRVKIIETYSSVNDPNATTSRLDLIKLYESQVLDLPVHKGLIHQNPQLGLDSPLPPSLGNINSLNGPYFEAPLPGLDQGESYLTARSSREILGARLPVLQGRLYAGTSMSADLPVPEAVLRGDCPLPAAMAGGLAALEGRFHAGGRLASRMPLPGDSWLEAEVPAAGRFNAGAGLPALSGTAVAAVPFTAKVSGILPGLASYMAGRDLPSGKLRGRLPSFRVQGGMMAAVRVGGRTSVFTCPVIRGKCRGDLVPAGDLAGEAGVPVGGYMGDAGNLYFGELRHVRGQVQ